jgi:hypothetical protein
MSKNSPDFADAELVIKLYDLRREEVMRRSRDAMFTFIPKSWDELFAVTKWEHPLNSAFRQVSTYWEMVYGMVKHGIVNFEYFMESQGEGLALFVKVEPHLTRYRQEVNPLAFQNAEWVAHNTERGRRLVEVFRKRFGITPPSAHAKK